MKFTPFNPSDDRSELKQMYVSAKDHEWIKKQAVNNSTRMVRVVSELIQHAEQSEQVFKRLNSAILQLDRLLPDDAPVPASLEEVITEAIEQYEEFKTQS